MLTPLLPTQVSDSPLAVVPAQYICAPDSKHPSLAAPAQLLLERFLQHHSHRFFPLSLRNHGHPVLLVDCYLNLGSQVTRRLLPVCPGAASGEAPGPRARDALSTCVSVLPPFHSW